MDRREFFLKGLLSGACKKRAWVTCCFSAISGNTPIDGEHYPYRIFVHNGDMYYIDPDRVDEIPADGVWPAGLAKMDDYIHGKPLFDFLEPFLLEPGDLENYSGPSQLVTTPGNVFVNHLTLCLPFGSAIPFQEGQISAGKIGDMLYDMLIDDPVDDDGFSPPPEGKIYCRQLCMHNEYMLSITFLAEDNVTAITRKSLTGHPERRRLREELIEKYKDRLNDPAIVARMGKVLEELDIEYLNDDESFKFYLSKIDKLLRGSRKKQFYFIGGEAPFSDGTSVKFIAKALDEGIDTKYFSTMVNTQRYGSFSRGFMTRFGGEKTKTIYRMLGTVKVEIGDCGDTVGIPVFINPVLRKRFLGFYYIERGVTKPITEENIDSLVGTIVNMRDPMSCKFDINRTGKEPGKGKNPCSICAGDALTQMPEGIPAASAAVGGRMMTVMLKKMHASSLKTVKWDFMKHIH